MLNENFSFSKLPSCLPTYRLLFLLRTIVLLSPFTVLAVVCNGLSLPVSATTGSAARQSWGVPGGVSLPPPQPAGAFLGGGVSVGRGRARCPPEHGAHRAREDACSGPHSAVGTAGSISEG